MNYPRRPNSELAALDNPGPVSEILVDEFTTKIQAEQTAQLLYEVDTIARCDTAFYLLPLRLLSSKTRMDLLKRIHAANIISIGVCGEEGLIVKLRTNKGNVFSCSTQNKDDLPCGNQANCGTLSLEFLKREAPEYNQALHEMVTSSIGRRSFIVEIALNMDLDKHPRDIDFAEIGKKVNENYGTVIYEDFECLLRALGLFTDIEYQDIIRWCNQFGAFFPYDKLNRIIRNLPRIDKLIEKYRKSSSSIKAMLNGIQVNSGITKPLYLYFQQYSNSSLRIEDDLDSNFAIGLANEIWDYNSNIKLRGDVIEDYYKRKKQEKVKNGTEGKPSIKPHEILEELLKHNIYIDLKDLIDIFPFKLGDRELIEIIHMHGKFTLLLRGVDINKKEELKRLFRGLSLMSERVSLTILIDYLNRKIFTSKMQVHHQTDLISIVSQLQINMEVVADQYGNVQFKRI
jgi:hypothetical protein